MDPTLNRPHLASALEIFHTAVTFTPEEYRAYKWNELVSNRERYQEAQEQWRHAALERADLQRRIQARQMSERVEMLQRMRFATVQERFGTAIALIDRNRWDLRKFSPNEYDYLMRCTRSITCLNFSNCRLPEGFGKVIADAFPRLERLVVRHSNFTDDDLEAICRHSDIQMIDIRGTRVRNEKQTILYSTK